MRNGLFVPTELTIELDELVSLLKDAESAQSEIDGYVIKAEDAFNKMSEMAVELERQLLNAGIEPSRDLTDVETYWGELANVALGVVSEWVDAVTLA